MAGDGVEEVGGGRRPAWGWRRGGRWRTAGSGTAGDVDTAAARTAGDGMEEVDGRCGLRDGTGLPNGGGGTRARGRWPTAAALGRALRKIFDLDLSKCET
uniref:DUF834 domain-containing protein n=1 Tax=Oryza meridionalis TaxID=40149 RepID=A0A0E0D258_9ORYZ